MSEETKNPLIESFLKLHEYKNPGRGGKDEPYQGRNLQPYMNQDFIPDALRVKPEAPKPVAPKVSAPEAPKVSAPIPKPTLKPANLDAAKPAAPGSENAAVGSIAKTTAERDLKYNGPAPVQSTAPSTSTVTPTSAEPKEPLSLPNRTDMERSTFNAQDLADTKDNPAALRNKLDLARQKIQGQGDNTPSTTSTSYTPPANAGEFNGKKTDNIFRLQKIKGQFPSFLNWATGKTEMSGSTSSRIAGALKDAMPGGRHDFDKTEHRNSVFYSTGKKRIPTNEETINSQESKEMTNKLIDSFLKLQSLNSSNIFEAAKKVKKLDPVGKEDEDIDNDGDKDKSDSYLHNRRKAIKAAMKEANDPYGEGIAKGGEKAPDMVPNPSYAKPKKTNEPVKGDLPADVSSRMERERKTNSEIGEPGSRQRSMIDSAKDAANRAGGLRSVEAITKGVGAAYGQGIAKAIDAVAGYKKPESKVIQNTGKSSIALKNEEVEVDEDYDHRKLALSKLQKSMADDDSKSKSPRIKQEAKVFRKTAERTAKKAVTGMDEEVQFSEAELAHIAAILEANPVAPTPDDYSGSKNGPSVRNLSDETVSEEEVKRGRGRPKGSKSGSAKGEGQAAGTPHVMDQIKFASARGIADGKGNYMIKHPTSGETRAVPQKAANDAYRAYHGEEKPAGKNAVLSGFLKKHGFSDTSAEKAPEEKRTTAEPKKSVSLPSIPKPKS